MMSGRVASFNPAGQYTWDNGLRNFKRSNNLRKRRQPGYSTTQRKKHKAFRDTELQQKKLNFSSAYNMNEFTRSRRYKRYQPYTIKKHLYPATASVEDRFQGLTNFDTNSGYCRISQFNIGATAQRWIPVHAFDLTSFPNNGTLPPVGYRFYWNDASTTSNITANNIIGQTSSGAGSTGAAGWQITQLNGASGPAGAEPRAFLKWVNLRFNFYGARNRTTTFKVHIVRFMTLNRNFLLNGTTAEAKDIMQYLERPLVFNNLQTDTTQTRRKMKIIKSYTYKVDPQQSTDLNTTTGKIHEANIFLRMNKAINLDWVDDGTHEAHAIPAGENNDGIDFEQRASGIYKTGPNYFSRVYAIVTAFSPEHRTIPAVAGFEYCTPSEAFAYNGSAGTAVNAGIEPSYDFLIRRGYCMGN